MRKVGLTLLSAALAGATLVPQVAGTETLSRTAGLEKGFEAYLPPVTPAVPWLNLERRTKLPRGDYPLGRDAASVGPLVLQAPHMQHADLAEFGLGGS